jgi:hypothetical protein
MKPASSTPEPTAAMAVASAWNIGMVANSAMNLQQQQPDSHVFKPIS